MPLLVTVDGSGWAADLYPAIIFVSVAPHRDEYAVEPLLEPSRIAAVEPTAPHDSAAKYTLLPGKFTLKATEDTTLLPVFSFPAVAPADASTITVKAMTAAITGPSSRTGPLPPKEP